MGIFKKLSIGSYVLALGVVLALIAMIIGITSSAKYEGFWEPTMGGVIAFTIFGIVFAAAAIALGVKFGDTFWTSAVLVIAVLFFALATCYMVMSKMDVMGTVVFSDLEKGFEPAEYACYVGLASSVIYIIATLVTAVGTFFRVVRKNAGEPAAKAA